MIDRSYLGIDFGTSGARAVVVDAAGQTQAQASVSFALGNQQDWADSWQETLYALLEQIPMQWRQRLGAIAINGTSSTVLLCDAQGRPLAPPLLYSDGRGLSVLDQVRVIAPAQHTVISATSSLAKLLWWVSQQIGLARECSSPSYFLHQADWLAFLLHGQLGVSDYHNALKLGYDVEALRYPDWMPRLPSSVQLPRVVAPGTPIGPVQPAIAAQFGLHPNCQVCAGTTDSIAAFLASGACTPGDAVTSLGSTLVLKLLSRHRVDEAQFGIYSHRLGDLWLVGGASNTGGAVLRQFFSPEDLHCLSQRIRPEHAISLDYYPLLQPGERFPVNDPHLPPRLEPRPADPALFLHGLLDSMARIEAQGYGLLQSLGATPLTRVHTAGGGAQNETWTRLRSRHLQVSVGPSVHTDAAYGTALLARSGRVQAGQAPLERAR